jgi:hypothetical protein
MPLGPERLAMMCGVSLDVFSAALNELFEFGVTNLDGDEIVITDAAMYSDGKKRNYKKTEISIDELTFPDSISDHECKTALDRFLSYKRTELGKPYKSKESVNALLKKCSDWTKSEFLESIQNTISSGSWQTLYKPKKNSRGLFDPLPPLKDRLPTKDEEDEINRIGLAAFAEKYNLK